MNHSAFASLLARFRLSEVARRIVSLVSLSLVLVVVGCNATLGGNDNGGGLASTSGGEEGCTGGTLECGSSCVAPLSDSLNCGGCGIACAAGQYCEQGICTGFCAQGKLDCGGVCQLTSSDPLHCGGCGIACPAGQFCDAGACSSECSGTLCTNTLGAQQCVHLASNNDNCGACGIACPDGQACQAGACVDSCPAGRLSCGAGCVDVRTDALNCGACGVACPAGQACVEGSCGGGTPVCTQGACTCTDGQEYCNETCVNSQTNALHCGGCGVECATGQTCTAGLCACPAGGTLCGAGCTNTMTDSANCGTCGTMCSGGTTCQAGTCQCEAGLSICDDTCVDQQTDPNHCGGCGIACESYEECVAGICKYDGDQCGGDARAISISRVALYQAVEMDLFEEGSVVSAEQRNVDVIQGRDAMVRVFVSPEGGFTNRELSARIFVENDQDIQVFHHKKMVSGASSQGNLSSTFQLQVPGDIIQGATKFWIELAECGELPDGTVGTVRVPTTPGENAEFSARQTGVIKMVFVPVTHDGRTPNVTEGVISVYAREVELQYPTTAVEWSVRSPIQSNQSGTNIDLGTTLDLVTDQRESDGVANDVYYYGLIDPASSFNNYCSGGCTTGVGWVPDVGGGWAASHRAAVGVGFETRGAGTFAHELGHNHGRNHAPCNVSGDNNYPYAGGSIGVWGYDPDEDELKDPSSHSDFMGYCNTTWVSDYSFNAYANRIAAINGVANLQQNVVSLGPAVTWYRMMVTDTGMHWSTPVERQGTPRDKGEVGYVYDSAGNVIQTVTVFRIEISHSNGYMLYVPEPQAGWFSVGLAGGPALVY